MEGRIIHVFVGGVKLSACCEAEWEEKPPPTTKDTVCTVCLLAAMYELTKAVNELRRSQGGFRDTYG